MTDRRGVIVNSMIYMAPRFVGMGIQVLTLPFLTRLLHPHDFGIVALAALFPNLAVGVFSWGLTIASQRFYFIYKEDSDRLGSYLFTIQLALHVAMVVTAVPVFIFRNEIARLFIRADDMGIVVFASYVSSFLTAIFSVYLTTLQNAGKAKAYVFLTVLNLGLAGILNIGLCAWFRSYAGLMYGALFSSATATLAGSIYFMKTMRFRFNTALLKESLRYGTQTLPKAINGFIDKSFDRYFLNRLTNVDGVGVYSIGQSVGASASSFMNAIWAAVQPLCYNEVFEKKEKASASVGRMFSYFLFATASPLMVFMLFAPELTRVLAPPSYGEAVNLIVVILCAISTNIFGMFIGVQFAYTGKPSYIALGTVTASLVNIALNVMLIPRWGGLGAATAMLGSYLALNTVLTLIGQSLYPIRYEWGFVLAVYGTIALAAGVVLVMRAMELTFVFQLVVKLGVLGILLVLGVRRGIATIETMKQIFRLGRIRPVARATPA